MIIRSLQVEGVRCFTEPVRIKFPGEGFTVLSGPNGSGKSTLVEAMRRCLLDNHNAVGAADLQHWSEARPPRIVIEFGHAGGRYRLTKQFVSKKQAVLERKDGGSWRVVEEGRAADDKVRQMLRASGRGETGILGVLWSPQGQLPLEGVSGGVVEEIRASLGAQMAGAAGLAFEKQLRKIYEAAWQPSRKQPKKGLLQDIEQKLSEERENAESAKSTLEQADQRGQAAERLRQQAAELRVQLTAFEANFESVRKQSQEREQLSGRVQELSRDHRTQDQLYQELWRRSDSIRTENERRARLRAETPGLIAQSEERERVERRSRELENAAKIAMVAAAEEDPELQAAIREADRAGEWTRAASDLDAAETKLRRVSELNRPIVSIRQELAQLNAPDATALNRIREVSEQQKIAEVRLEKLELRLAITAESALEVEVAAGKPAGRHEIVPGNSTTITGDLVNVRLPGIASLQVAGPETDRTKWQRQADTAEMEMRELCAPFGESDLAVLAERAGRRVDLEGQVRAAQQARGEAMGKCSEAELRDESDRFSAARRKIEREYPAWSTTPPDAAALREAATQRGAGREGLRRNAHAEWQKLHNALMAYQSERQFAETAVEINRSQLTECERRLQELESDGKTGDQRGQDLDEVRRRRDSVAIELAAAQQQLAAIPAEVNARAEKLWSEIGTLHGRIAEADRKATEETAAQRTLLSIGSYTTLTEAEESIAVQQEAWDAEKLRLDAIRLLWETYEEEKQRALDGIAEPVSVRATAILSKIAGEKFADLKISPDFSETAIWPSAKQDEASTNEMSGGEQEQIALAVRMALAGYVAESEPQLMVLDDVLLNTDSERLGRILALLEESRDRMQVLIVTCHPERYKRLRGVRNVTLPLAAAAVSTE